MPDRIGRFCSPCLPLIICINFPTGCAQRATKDSKTAAIADVAELHKAGDGPADPLIGIRESRGHQGPERERQFRRKELRCGVVEGRRDQNPARRQWLRHCTPHLDDSASAGFADDACLDILFAIRSK